MKDLFYFLVMAFFLIATYETSQMEEVTFQDEMNQYEDYIVVNKYPETLFVKNMITMQKDTNRVSIFADDLVFNNVAVGDTIKISK